MQYPKAPIYVAGPEQRIWRSDLCKFDVEIINVQIYWSEAEWTCILKNVQLLPTWCTSSLGQKSDDGSRLHRPTWLSAIPTKMADGCTYQNGGMRKGEGDLQVQGLGHMDPRWPPGDAKHGGRHIAPIPDPVLPKFPFILYYCSIINCSILTSIALISSQDFAVKSHPDLFTRFNHTPIYAASSDGFSDEMCPSSPNEHIDLLDLTLESSDSEDEDWWRYSCGTECEGKVKLPLPVIILPSYTTQRVQGTVTSSPLPKETQLYFTAPVGDSLSERPMPSAMLLMVHGLDVVVGAVKVRSRMWFTRLGARHRQGDAKMIVVTRLC
ncbi:hypothetical protein PR048_014068 [Dryococelus australis]|uniref:Leptin receptor n=1 Tax=Dryococelus australis TaxID=614101 RepID=A0ABQ9HTX4_9NEOP|nr:hypothetical protein PR048_014068 [Dryococelus australis]